MDSLALLYWFHDEPTGSQPKGAAMTLSDLAGALRIANNDRLDGRITREQHAVFVRTMQTQLDRNGWDWDALAAEMKATA